MNMSAHRLVSSSLVALALLAAPLTASAQRYVPSATFEAGNGMQGGGGRESSLVRAPTRLRAGADVHVDEDPENVIGAAGIVDLEPRTRFGADLRYIRTVGEHFALSGGAIAYITPGTMIGPAATLEYRHPFAKQLMLTAGPEVNVFVVGIDVPDKTVIWQALLHIGLRVDL
ncbi:MAG: hypothetical protein JWP97_6641 [Labilithrix sp.]|nr:hypothetical protein [Labilithrix sp.]